LRINEESTDKRFKDSSVDPRSVNHVFLIGGSSFVPAVRRIFEIRAVEHSFTVSVSMRGFGYRLLIPDRF
jgi:hypothetical protein